MSCTIVIGGFFGSEGKGSVVSWLATQRQFDMAIRTGGSNAGHTFLAEDGKLYKMQQLPCTWSAQPLCPLYIPAGGIISLDRLEIESKWVNPTPIWISPSATIITDDAKNMQKGITTGSTFEGVGGARALKAIKKATIARDYRPNLSSHFSNTPRKVLDDPKASILIETTQGFALSIDWERYPYCSSGNVTTYRALDDAEVPFGVHDIDVWMILRTYPIRIAGNSGYLYREISWKELRERHGNHIPDEQTTVTKKTRRVGEFDSYVAKEAIRRINPGKIVLTFVDYLFPNIGSTGITDEVRRCVNGFEGQIGRSIDYVGIGTGKIVRMA